ncbi:MAG: beta-ketoacyl-ACP synthase III [Deltaproteobacteria bacterium]
MARATSRILGWGAADAELVVTNDELAAVVDSSDEWIAKRTGIRQRRYVNNGDGSVAMGEKASRDALEMAATAVDEVDVIIACTISPDIDFPGNAVLLQQRLGLGGKPAFDVRNQCSGFVYGLSIADQFIQTGASRVLLVGSEIHSSGLDFEGGRGRDLTVLFGDGAGAVVIGPSQDGRHGLLSFGLHAEGRYADKLCTIGPSHRRSLRLDVSTAPPDDTYVYPIMDGRYVFKHAVTRMTEVITEVAEEAGIGVGEIDMLLPHQANLRINQLVALGLGLDDTQISNNIDRYGNTTAATIPILLTETAAAGRIKEGDLVCLAAFGAGFTWGAALYRW